MTTNLPLLWPFIKTEVLFDFFYPSRQLLLPEYMFTEEHLVHLTVLPSLLRYSSFLFFLGLLGTIYNYRNFLVTMMSIELMYLGTITIFVLYGTFYHDPQGIISGLLLLITAASESAIGLGILIVLYRFGRSIDFTTYSHLGG